MSITHWKVFISICPRRVWICPVISKERNITVIITNKHILITISIYVSKGRWRITTFNNYKRIFMIDKFPICICWRTNILIKIDTIIIRTNNHIIITISIYINKCWCSIITNINWIIIRWHQCPIWYRRSPVILIIIYVPCIVTNKQIIITIAIYINEGGYCIITNINWIIIRRYQCPIWYRRSPVISKIWNITVIITNKHIIITVTIYINKGWCRVIANINWIIIIWYQCPRWWCGSSIITIIMYVTIIVTNKQIIITIIIYINKSWCRRIANINWIIIIYWMCWPYRW